MPREVHIRYHYEPDEGTWWADSPDLERWTAVGDTFASVRSQAHEGASYFAGERVMIVEDLPEHAPASGHGRAIVVTTGGAFGVRTVAAGVVPSVTLAVRGVRIGSVRREGALAETEIIGA